MSSFDLHHLLLSDRPRLDAFRRALHRTVRPGDVVVDLGAGTGILGLLALQAGAGRVYAVDPDPILRLARKLARENGVEERMRFVEEDARTATLPERADLIVSDLGGMLGMDPEMSKVVVAARRFLKRGGRILPQRSRVWAGLVRAPSLHRAHVRPGAGCGVALEAVHRLAAHRVGRMAAVPGQWAAGPRPVFDFDFARDAAAFPRRSRIRFRAARSGPVHGMGLRTETRLLPGLSLESRTGSSRRPVFLPLERPLRLERGERVEAELVLHDATTVEWRVGDRRHCTLFEEAAYV